MIKEFFLNYRRRCTPTASCPASATTSKPLATPARLAHRDDRHRALAQHRRALLAVRPHVEGEEMFLANYSDGLSDVDLPAMIEAFRDSGRSPVSSPCIPLSACT